MDEDTTIVEVTEAFDISLGDDMLLEEVPVNAEEESMQDAELWKELSMGKRIQKSLELAYLADFTVKVRNSKFRCHKYILSIASPKFASMIRKNPNEMVLQNVEPNHFKILLDIIYSEETDDLHDLTDAMAVARAAHELQTYTALTYCSKLLRDKVLDSTSVCLISDFACLVNDEDLKEACSKVISENTDEIVKSETFLNCSMATLELILRQENMVNVTELDLFLACARWAEKHKHPRQVLGPALSLIRFLTLTPQEFVKSVKPTQLLTAEEENKFLSYFLTGEGADVPSGFSTEKNKRKIRSCAEDPIIGQSRSKDCYLELVRQEEEQRRQQQLELLRQEKEKEQRQRQQQQRQQCQQQ